MLKKYGALLTFILVATLLTTGCGPSRPETATVEGTVTYKGKPIEGARVTFYPPRSRPAGGTTGADGKFSLMTFEEGDGVILGECNVSISKQTGSPPDATHPLGIVTHFLPAKYANPKTSGLVEMVESGKNTFNFDLKD